MKYIFLLMTVLFAINTDCMRYGSYQLVQSTQNVDVDMLLKEVIKLPKDWQIKILEKQVDNAVAKLNSQCEKYGELMEKDDSVDYVFELTNYALINKHFYTYTKAAYTRTLSFRVDECLDDCTFFNSYWQKMQKNWGDNQCYPGPTYCSGHYFYADMDALKVSKTKNCYWLCNTTAPTNEVYGVPTPSGERWWSVNLVALFILKRALYFSNGSSMVVNVHRDEISNYPRRFFSSDFKALAQMHGVLIKRTDYDENKYTISVNYDNFLSNNKNLK